LNGAFIDVTQRTNTVWQLPHRPHDLVTGGQAASAKSDGYLALGIVFDGLAKICLHPGVIFGQRSGSMHESRKLILNALALDSAYFLKIPSKASSIVLALGSA
jgi:hypothetical protein